MNTIQVITKGMSWIAFPLDSNWSGCFKWEPGTSWRSIGKYIGLEIMNYLFISNAGASLVRMRQNKWWVLRKIYLIYTYEVLSGMRYFDILKCLIKRDMYIFYYFCALSVYKNGDIWVYYTVYC